MGGVVVASSIRCTIARKVLDTGENVVRAPYGIPLKAAHLCLGHARPEKRIFAGAFHNASPARVASDIDHRGKGPVDADGTGLSRGHGLNLLCKGGIPGC